MTDLIESFEQRNTQRIPLKFNTIDLKSREDVRKYVIEYFETYNINKHHIKFRSNVEYTLNESSDEYQEIQPFIQTIARVDSKKTVQVGDTFSVLGFEIRFAWREIDAFGFVHPHRVIDVVMDHDDNSTINYIKFANGDRYPRMVQATYNGKPIVYSAYFENEHDAGKALTLLTLQVPSEWDMDVSGIT